jgi:hypothetical protein
MPSLSPLARIESAMIKLVELRGAAGVALLLEAGVQVGTSYCALCPNPLKHSGRKYCSAACSNRAKRVATGGKRCKLQACGKLFHRHPRRSDAEWASQEYCSGACASKARARPPESKVCKLPGCEEVFHRTPGCSPANWDERDYCSRKCSHKAKVRPPETKPCQAPGCAKSCVRPRGCSDQRWAAWRYCSAACTNLALEAKRAPPVAPTSPPPPPAPKSVHHGPVLDSTVRDMMGRGMAPASVMRLTGLDEAGLEEVRRRLRQGHKIAVVNGSGVGLSP